jgi:DNA helicase-2/ATP-dependent DNA helicase PcrA
MAELDEVGGPLASFLAHAALEAGDHQAGAGSDALQLMTVHAAKGLEFHAVFVGGLEEGLFPHEQSMNEKDGIEEERRLMYVAITRARRRLYLSHAQSRMLHGQVRYGIPSRFLDELPSELLKLVNAKRNSPVPVSHDSYVAPKSGARNNTSPWRIGMNVRHAKFGLGVVVNVEGQGEDTRVQINFGAANGMKWLALAYAKLEVA